MKGFMCVFMCVCTCVCMCVYMCVSGCGCGKNNKLEQKLANRRHIVNAMHVLQWKFVQCQNLHCGMVKKTLKLYG